MITQRWKCCLMNWFWLFLLEHYCGLWESEFCLFYFNLLKSCTVLSVFRVHSYLLLCFSIRRILCWTIATFTMVLQPTKCYYATLGEYRDLFSVLMGVSRGVYFSLISESRRLKAYVSKVRWITGWWVQYLTNFRKWNRSQTQRPWSSSPQVREKMSLCSTRLCGSVCITGVTQPCDVQHFPPFLILFYR